MKYEPLYKSFYRDEDEYQEIYFQRFNNSETVKLGINIHKNEAFYMPCSEIYELILDIMRTDKKVSLIKENLPKEAIHSFQIESLIDEIMVTNSIEGVRSTRREIKDVLEALQSGKRQDKRFEGLVNQYVLLGQKDISLLSSEDIRSLYDELVLNEVIANNPDNAPDGILFRKQTVDVVNPAQVVIHTGVFPEEKIIEDLQISLEFLNNEEINVLIRAAGFHYLFGYIHPFYDGNGRISRFISSYYLAKELDALLGNRLSYTIQDNISEYYKMFKVCNDPINKGDLTPFIIMFLSVVQKAEEKLLRALSKRRDLFDENLGRIWTVGKREKWDDSVRSLCATLLINSLFAKQGLTKKELQKDLKIKSVNTLNTKLDKLRKLNLIEEKREGNKIYISLRYENL